MFILLDLKRLSHICNIYTSEQIGFLDSFRDLKKKTFYFYECILSNGVYSQASKQQCKEYRLS